MSEIKAVFRGADVRDEFLAVMSETFSQEAVERKRRAWDWLFKAPFRTETNPARVLTIERAGRLVGGVFLLPTEVTLDGVPTPAVLPIGNNIRPNDRGAGMVTLKTCFNLGHGGITVGLASSDRLSAVWVRLGAAESPPRTLCRKLYRPGSILALRGRLPRMLGGPLDAVFRLPLAIIGIMRPSQRKTERIVPIETFGPEFDTAWEAARPSVKCAISRTSAHLQWRHIESPFPAGRCLALYRDRKLAGYVAITIAPTGSGPAGRVTDIFAYTGTARDYGLLLAAADAEFMRARCTYGEIAYGCSKAIDTAAWRAGFFSRKQTRPLNLGHENPDARADLPRLAADMHFCRADHDEDY
ncbi:hypothetical protein SAMN05878503_10860 [Cereibacter ovatus]|uniref:GNAT family N-acetyltransferase n=2 Tax=Cereibacter ovatus TaxID=439529 RepID=A0A285CU69_9RHOB|nr:hypothetical protein SAMN05878503_10860 [Cereibacter ovatus]